MKKYVEKVISIILCIVMLFTVTPLGGAFIFSSAETDPFVSNNLNVATGVIVFKGTGEMTNPISYDKTSWYEVRTKIKTAKINDGVTSIGDYTFYDCTNLTSVRIPDTLKKIGKDAFYNCNSLSDIYYCGTAEEWKAIKIESGNSAIQNADLVYNFEDPEVHTHSYRTVITKAATCTESGIKTFVCDCGDSKTETIEKTGHNFKHTKVAPTCEKSGYEYDQCTNCKVKNNEKTLPIADHIKTHISVSSTCNSAGYEYDQCVNCKAEFDRKNLPLAEHNKKRIIVSSTCKTAGYEYFQCEACNEKFDEKTLPLADHNTKHIKFDSTCQTMGYEYDECTACGAQINKTDVPLGDHSYGEWEVVSQSTCITEGTRIKACSVCNDSFIETMPKTEHTIVEIIVRSTCLETGYRYDECSVCKEIFNKSDLPIGEHETKHIKVDSTCEEAGFEYDECTLCGKISDYKDLNLSEHLWGDWQITKIPTTDAEGEEERSCSVCGNKETRAISEVLLDLSSKTTELTLVVNTVNGPKLTWEPVSEAAAYYVYRRTSGKSWTRLASTTETSYTDATAKSGVTYIYTAKAYDDTASSKYQDGLTIKYLASPTVNAISNTTAGANLKWSASEGASRYYIYRKTADGSYKNIGNTTSTSFTDNTAPNGVKYYYTVRSGNGNVLSSYRPGKGLVFLTSPTVSSVANITTGVRVAWDKTDGASGYYVYRKETATGTYTKVGTTASTSFVDKTAKSGTSYYYTVRAYKGSAQSSYRAGTGMKYLTSPTIATVSNTKSGAKVVWNKSVGASGYCVYRKTANGSYARVGTTASASFVDKTAKKGTTYYYTVRAYNGKVLSSYRAGARLTRK